jgi:hypothetical protein
MSLYTDTFGFSYPRIVDLLAHFNRNYAIARDYCMDFQNPQNLLPLLILSISNKEESVPSTWKSPNQFLRQHRTSRQVLRGIPNPEELRERVE